MIKAIRQALSKPAVLFPLAALWLLAIGAGATVLVKYANTPGRLAAPPEEWPANVPILPVKGEHTLLVFLHPECPCSRATIEELAHVMAARVTVQSFVFFFAPNGSPEWRHSDLYESAKRIPGVRVLPDPDGFVGQRFGAHTSGQTLLYDSRGHLLFNGGITASRGHVGDNDGVDAIAALLRGEVPATRTTPVFGCLLDGGN